MTEQEIRFCTTSDGVNIAYGISGGGPPLVFVHGWGSHLEFARTMPGFEQSLFNLLAQRHQFVRYDGRGFGLSDRGVKNFSIDHKIRDLEAVVDSLPLDQFAMIGTSEGGPTAMTYAQRHPERVTKLVLSGTFAKMILPTNDPELAELRVRMMAFQGGWEKGTPEFRQLWGAQFVPDGSPEIVAWFNEMGRQSSDGETMLAAVIAVPRIDVTEIARQISVPTLVVHARGDRAVPFERGRELASLIPGARFVPVEGNNHIPLPGDPQTMRMVQAIEEFLGVGGQAPPTSVASGGGLVTILFTDLVGHTEMMSRLGDERGRDVLREHERITREVLKANSGTEVKTMGDGFMASFGSVTKAVECAVALQRAFAEREGEPLSVRVGLNAGEPIEEDGDLFGATVILASRIAAMAGGGEILVADTVRGLCSGKGFLFADRVSSWQGIEEPVRVYEVSWRANH
jgi:Predicted hydrolases or acyltransferases (alpha/beta hydrolase superfamily)